MGKRLVTVMLLLLAAFPVVSQEPPAAGDAPVKMTVASTNLGVKNICDVVIDVTHDGIRWDIELIVPELPEGVLYYTRFRSPQQRLQRDSEGDITRIYSFVSQPKPMRAGMFIIPPYEVRIKGKSYFTEPFVLRAGYQVDGEIVLPLEVEWSYGADKIYVGQVFPVILEVLKQESISLFTDVDLEPPRDAFFEQSEYLGDISSQPFGPILLYSVPAISYLVTPSSTGVLTLPEAAVSAGPAEGIAASRRIEVLPVPENIAATHAIGTFSVSSGISANTVAEGGTLSVSISVEGTGNLNYLQIPEPEVTGLDLMEKRESQNIVQAIDGYSGNRGIEFLYSALSGERFTVTVADFPYLDPVLDRVRVIRGRSWSGGIVRSESLESEPVVFPFSPVPVDLITAYWPLRFDRKWETALALLPGPFLGLIILFLLRRRNRMRALPTLLAVLLPLLLSAGIPAGDTSGLERAAAAYERGEFEAALEYSLEAAAQYPENGQILYNCALYASRAGNIGKAVRYARDAIYLDPLEMETRQFLKWLEMENGLERQYPPVSIWYPGLFLAAALLFWNLYWLLFPFFLNRKQLRTGILPITLGLLICFSTAGYGIAVLRERPDDGVLIRQTAVRKIPRSDAESGITLPEGLAVKRGTGFGDYVFVDTAYDLSGWIRVEDLASAGETYGF